ncbi:MAG: cobalt transporter [Silicimonas sp.]|nr:cobalt transporter [Silicimonas sp.]
MFTRILTSALIAGASAGFLAALLQLAFVQPVLLQAELFESGALVYTPGTPWPQVPFRFDPLRDGLSILFAMLVYAGYGLILVALMSLAEEKKAVITARTGLLWGVAGFVTVHLAPSISLAPEVPGGAAADITARQIWWFATVIAAGVALWLIAFGKGWSVWMTGVILLLAPHLVGAPHPATLNGPVPPEIAALFAARALGVGLAAWVILGLLAGALWASDAEVQEAT